MNCLGNFIVFLSVIVLCLLTKQYTILYTLNKIIDLLIKIKLLFVFGYSLVIVLAWWLLKSLRWKNLMLLWGNSLNLPSSRVYNTINKRIIWKIVWLKYCVNTQISSLYYSFNNLKLFIYELWRKSFVCFIFQ